MNYLQIALLSNALFSLFTGISLILFRKTIADWFGLQNATIFWIVGIGLLVFSYTVYGQVKNPRPDAVFFIVAQDLLWVLVSLVLLLFKPFNITVLGNQIMAGVALLVLMFGIVQALGLTYIDNHKGQNIKQLVFERVVNAPIENTWEVISDVANYHEVAPNIDKVKIISGNGEGMVRSCSHKEASWTETCTLWKPNDSYAFEVNTAAPNYPYPLKYLHGTWKVEKVSDTETIIKLIFEFTYKRKIYNLLIHPFLRKSMDEICHELLNNWQAQLAQTHVKN